MILLTCCDFSACEWIVYKRFSNIELCVCVFRKNLMTFANLWNINEVGELQKWKCVSETKWLIQLLPYFKLNTEIAQKSQNSFVIWQNLYIQKILTSDIMVTRKWLMAGSYGGFNTCKASQVTQSCRAGVPSKRLLLL